MKGKLLSALAAVTALLLLGSCSDITSGEEAGNSGKRAYIKVGVSDSSSRLALPLATTKLFESLILTGEATGGLSVNETWTSDTGEDNPVSAYEKMTQASLAVTAGKTYGFTLTAIYGGATWLASLQKEILSGENSLTFELKLSALSTEGEGALTIFVSYPDKVKAVDAVLKSMDESSKIADLECEFIPELEGFVAVHIEKVDSGNYVVIFTLWGDEEKTLSLGQWREYAGVTDKNASISHVDITDNDDLANIYEINLDYAGGTSSLSSPGSYTRYSDDIILPAKKDMKKDYYEFTGWSDGEKIVSKIEKGSVGNISLTATWKLLDYEINYNLEEDAQNAEANPATFTVESEFDFADPERDGFVFAGWFDEDGNKVTGIKKNTAGLLTLYPKWKPLVKGISVTLGKIDGDKEVKLEFDQESNKFTASEGFASYEWRIEGDIQNENSNVLDLSQDFLIGWNSLMLLVKDSNGNVYSAEATFHVEERKYRLLLDLNGGEFITNAKNDEIILYENDIYFIKGLEHGIVRKDYVFAGWYKVTLDEDGKEVLEPWEQYTVSSDFFKKQDKGCITLRAAWVPALIEITIEDREDLNALPDAVTEAAKRGIENVIIKIKGLSDYVEPPEDWSTVEDESQYTNSVFYLLKEVIASNSYVDFKIDLSESSLTYIPFEAFYLGDEEIVAGDEEDYISLSNLTEIVLPDTLTAILTSAFDSTGIKEITIPASVKLIGKWAFYGTAIEEITIPASVKKIGESAFEECTSLESISFEGTMEQWNAISFGNCVFVAVPCEIIVCSDGDIYEGEA